MAAMLTLVGGLLFLLLIATSNRGRDIVFFLTGFAAAFDHAQIAGLHVSTLLAFLLLQYPAQAPLRKTTKRRLFWLGASITMLAATVLFGALVNSRLLGLQLVLLAIAGAVVCWRTEARTTDILLRGLWFGLILACTYAAFQYLGLVPPEYFVDSSGIDRVSGPYREPDFLAYFASIGLVLSFRIIKDFRLQVIGSGLFAFILIVSFARASYVGLIAATAIVLIVRGSSRLVRGQRPPTWLAATLGASALAFLATNGHLRETLAQRVSDAAQPDSGDVAVRARSGQLETLLDLAGSAPWHGWGLSAAGRVQDLGHIVRGESVNNVATNWVLDWWVGGKYVAIPLVLFVIWLAVRARTTVAGFLFLITVITSLFTNAMILPITFALIGICLRELELTSPTPHHVRSNDRRVYSR